MAIIGRNIIAQPRNPSDMPSWAAQMYGTTRAPMNQNFNGAAVELPGIGSTTPVIGNTTNGAVGVTFDGADMLPGRRVKFGVWYSTTAGANDMGLVMLMPQFHFYANRHWSEPSSKRWGAYTRAIGEYEDKLLALTVDAPKSVDGYIYVESEPVELPDFQNFQALNAQNSHQTYEAANEEMTWAVAVANGAMNNIRLAAVRVDIELGDEYVSNWYSGYVDGSKTDDGEISFDWSGDQFDSVSHAIAEIEPEPDPEPDPEPEPEPGEYVNTVAGRVATALSVDPTDDEAMGIVLEGANTVIMFAYAYCRGNGFTMTGAGDIVTNKPDITAAIVAGATRYAANPTGLEYRAGTETVSGAFGGWTLAEQAVLNNYRKRWA